MAKAANIILPRGKPQNNNYQAKLHFDSIDNTYSEKHDGKYLIVKNNKHDKRPHNRLYLCQTSGLEYMKTYALSGQIEAYNTHIAKHHLLTLYPEYSRLILSTITKLVKENASRDGTVRILEGMGYVIDMLILNNDNLNSFSEFTAMHLETMEEVVKHGSYLTTHIRNLGAFLKLILPIASETLIYPNLQKYAKKKFNNDDKGILSLAVMWQLDIYARKELDTLISRAKEYQKWMKELDEIGELFSLENLAYSYYSNTKKYGGASGGINMPIRKLAKVLHGVELQCWEERKKENYKYLNKKDEQQHHKLLNLAKSGINITIVDERMLSMWHKTIAPNYPYDKEILPCYKKVWALPINKWYYTYAKKISGHTSGRVLDSRIYPRPSDIYPLYLLSLIRTGLNQDVVKNWQIEKNEQGKYYLGINAGIARIIDGFKGRGNSKQSAILDRDMVHYVDFFTEWLTPLYNNSDSKHFFQYLDISANNNKPLIQYLSSSTLVNLSKLVNRPLFSNNEILDNWVSPDEKNYAKRIEWINHNEIRKFANLSRYLQGMKKWERQFLLGHKSIETETTYQQTVNFAQVDEHRIAASGKMAENFIRGTITTEDHPRLNIFETPLSGCRNPKKPSYPGAKEMKDDDVCTNWRKCLSGCSESKVIPKVHGPVILAWKYVMDEMHDELIRDGDWEKEFEEDYEIVESTLNSFNKPVMELCKKEAPSYMLFVRHTVLYSREKRNLREVENG